MASSEHLATSDFIKTVHQRLRDEAKALGAEEAWQKHCEDEENLKKYAAAMHNLASNHWESNYEKNSNAVSRVEWVSSFVKKYFQDLKKFREKEATIAEKIQLDVIWTDETGPYRLLDVGSCYNPFKKYPCFNVVPIDIAPATSDVLKCDFLKVDIDRDFKRQSFEVVVFSLFLEYLPSPCQRLLCCSKAYELLKTEGILVIITPDSKHVGANAKIMKTWRFLLAKIGFSRVKYEKLPYLHCMGFRKSLKPEIAQRWALLQNSEHFYSQFVIPQDFKKAD